MPEMRLIDANAVVTIRVFDEMTEEYSMETMTVAEAMDRWADEGCPPTIDAVPVVRCRECKHSDTATTPDGTLYCVAKDEYVRAECFCYDGEKMDGGA